MEKENLFKERKIKNYRNVEKFSLNINNVKRNFFLPKKKKFFIRAKKL